MTVRFAIVIMGLFAGVAYAFFSALDIIVNHMINTDNVKQESIDIIQFIIGIGVVLVCGADLLIRDKNTEKQSET